MSIFQRNPIQRSACLAASSIIALATVPALAQPAPRATAPAPAADPSGNADIIVTAQGREQRLKDVPVSASVVSGATLERKDLRSLADLTARLPNVKITPGQSSDVLSIRGVGSGQNPGLEQSVATFVDGLYRARSRGIRAAIFDVDRVEVLKGPQITFFGANAIAGALNIATRKPSATFGANATALYGTDNEYLLEAGVTGPITDTLSVRVAGRANGMDDFVDNAAAARRGRLREYTGRLSLRWEPTARFRSDLRVEGTTSRNSAAYDGELLNCPTDTAYPAAGNIGCGEALALGGGTVDDKLDRKSNIVPGYANLDFYEIGWTNALDLGSVKLKSVTGYYDHKSHVLQDLIPVGPTGPDNLGSLMVPANDLFHQFSQEVRLETKVGDVLDLLAGVYYQKSRLQTDSYADFRFLPFGSFLPPFANPAGYTAATQVAGYAVLFQDENTKSAFAAATLRPVAHLRINGGLRYTVVSKDADRSFVLGSHAGGVVSSPGAALIPAPLVTQQFLAANVIGGDLANFPNPWRRDKRLMPSVGVQYDVTPDVMAYATFSTGFKAGGFGGTNVIESYGPESVKAYEIGAKGSLFDRALNVTLAAFRSDYRDLQEATIVFLPSGSVIAVTTNAASARSQGVEFGSTLRLGPALTLSADVAYLDSRFRNYPNGGCTVLQTLARGLACSQDLSGKRRPFAPEFSGNIGASLTVPAGAYQVRIDPSVYFVTDYNQQAGNDPLYVQKGYAKADLRVGFGPADGRWELAAIGKNLTDKQTASFRSGVTASPGSVIAFPERGRSVALQFTIKQ